DRQVDRLPHRARDQARGGHGREQAPARGEGRAAQEDRVQEACIDEDRIEEDRLAQVIRIGCASWSIASRQAGLFGEGDSTLSRYATRFSVVEVNSTFHRRHRPDTFVRWAAAVPRTFRFSVKLPKTITHEARLVRSAAAIRDFARDIAGLGAKLGGVLVQLPPSLAFDA